MRRAAAALVGTVLGLVLLLGFKSHGLGHKTLHAAFGPATGGIPTTAPVTGGSSGSSTGSTGGSTGSSSSGTKTATGDSVDTRWGPVQVKVTKSGGRITDIAVLDAPANNSRDIEINDYALPILKQEAMSAQSAQIDAVSGATYTSEGYIGSLQSALDQLSK
jgi:uncharacterized protein with FMN-binding domain